MKTTFFKKFPKVQYDVSGTGASVVMTNITPNIQVIKENISNYSIYRVVNGERPDVVSHKLYGKPDYHWTFFLINEHLKGGMGEWPSDAVSLERAIDANFGDHSCFIESPYLDNLMDGEYLSLQTIPNEPRIWENLVVSTDGNDEANIVEFDADSFRLIFERGDISSKIDSVSEVFLKPKEGADEDVIMELARMISDLSGVSSEEVFDLKYRVIPSLGREFAKYAPAVYFDEEENTLTAYDALLDIVQNDTTPTFVTVLQSIVNDNDEKSFIRIIKPEAVDKLARQFFTSLNE